MLLTKVLSTTVSLYIYQNIDYFWKKSKFDGVLQKFEPESARIFYSKLFQFYLILRLKVLILTYFLCLLGSLDFYLLDDTKVGPIIKFFSAKYTKQERHFFPQPQILAFS